MILACQQCGAKFKPAQIVPGRTRFCSAGCRSRSIALRPETVLAILSTSGSCRSVAQALEISSMSVWRVRRLMRQTHREMSGEMT
jgi:hypothetical protein